MSLRKTPLLQCLGWQSQVSKFEDQKNLYPTNTVSLSLLWFNIAPTAASSSYSTVSEVRTESSKLLHNKIQVANNWFLSWILSNTLDVKLFLSEERIPPIDGIADGTGFFSCQENIWICWGNSSRGPSRATYMKLSLTFRSPHSSLCFHFGSSSSQRKLAPISILQFPICQHIFFGITSSFYAYISL